MRVNVKSFHAERQAYSSVDKTLIRGMKTGEHINHSSEPRAGGDKIGNTSWDRSLGIDHLDYLIYAAPVYDSLAFRRRVWELVSFRRVDADF